MEEKAALWEAEQLEANTACLREMRALVPPDILQSSVQSMMDDGMPKSIANRYCEVGFPYVCNVGRLWSKRVLWLLRSHPDDIKRIHIADLRSKYSNQGLDIVEMRAVYLCLPVEFDNDGDGKKVSWLEYAFLIMNYRVNGAQCFVQSWRSSVLRKITTV